MRRQLQWLVHRTSKTSCIVDDAKRYFKGEGDVSAAHQEVIAKMDALSSGVVPAGF